VLSVAETIPSEEKVLAVCASFVGEILQTPPMYSALKVNGRKLVDLAREGIVVERQARPVTVHSLQARRLAEDLYELDVCCSKGTYIRTLCADIGAKLGCGGVMARLTRTESGPFTLAESVTVSELEAMTEAERTECVIPLEKFFLDCPAVDLPAFYARLARNGCEIYQKKIRTALPVGTVVRMIHDGVFFALGEVRDYPDGSAVKAIKIFVL
jgi:tRNA pseudouridine55 synthase